MLPCARRPHTPDAVRSICRARSRARELRVRGGPPCGVRHGRPRTPECRAPGPRPHARVACTASSLLGLQWHPLSAARRSSRCLRLAAVQLLSCSCCSSRSCCCTAAAVQLLPCGCCRAAAAVQHPPAQLPATSADVAATLPRSCTGRQRWSRHERSARVLRAAAPGAKSPRHPAGRRARSAAAKTPPSTLCCGASRPMVARSGVVGISKKKVSALLQPPRPSRGDVRSGPAQFYAQGMKV